ncbi:hypothetical protein [Shinella zoogloeoides]|uniref:Uncharacterized protein n=1 Tax=Shinella zoogloeoides TaxID=352475 RepID=A0A6N8TAD8_SHIZO|nr:hypothetical protein [Shinella zoogloeoides]MXN99414.1 hypothetical protein [Shinella zoogloeoides]UEX82807.1 hypothetical protein K8M09_05875 [Shinella zoogloeoides]
MNMLLLQETIDVISEQLATVPALDSSSTDRWIASRDAVREAEGRVINLLNHRFGARVNEESGNTSVSIHGVRSTSTMGLRGALGNWQSAARRRLEQAGAK